MKKLFFLSGIMILLFFSCMSTQSAGVVFDDSLPVEKSSWISMYNVGTITGYNGISVNWKSSASKSIQIPAGGALLEMDIDSTQGNIIYKGRNMLFLYEFQPQKQYLFIVGKQDGGAGLKVHTYDIGEKIRQTQSGVNAHFTEFVPFLNTGDSGGKTILN